MKFVCRFEATMSCDQEHQSVHCYIDISASGNLKLTEVVIDEPVIA